MVEWRPGRTLGEGRAMGWKVWNLVRLPIAAALLLMVIAAGVAHAR